MVRQLTRGRDGDELLFDEETVTEEESGDDEEKSLDDIIDAYAGK